MSAETWWAIFGWIGSAVIVFSLIQTKIERLRIFNLIGGTLAVAYNAVLGIWPSVGLNAVIMVINVVQLIRLRRAKRAAGTEHAPDETPSEAAPASIET